MELKRYIESTVKVIIPSIDNIQLVEYKNKELDFVYGMEQYHTSFKRMFKQIIRIIWQ
jgi:molecular chaperone GrpE (heat shock protein)